MIDELPAAPDPANDLPADFSKKAAALVLAQKAMVPQINTAIANFNASFSGNAYAIPYTIDLSGTSDIDPGAGKLRFDNATQNLATTLRLDPLGAGTPAVDYTAMIDTFDSSTSTVKGHIRIVKLGDASKFLLFSVSARTAPSGYRDISVAPVASSSANPFVAGDGVLLFFQRTGDKGDTGSVASFPVMVAREEQPSGTSSGASITLNNWNTRVFNTVKVNEIAGASLASNQITLPVGTYEYEGSCGASGCTAHKAQLYNVTDGVSIDVGTSELANPSTVLTSRSILRGKFTLSAAKALSVRHYINGSTGSFGGPVSAGVVEVYAEIKFKKVA